MNTALPTGTLKLRAAPVKKARTRQLRSIDRDEESFHDPDVAKSLHSVEIVNDGAAERFELLTVEEVAELLRVTPKGIYAMTSGRRIPFVRVSNRVRFRRDEIERWLDGNRVDVARAK